MSKSKIHRKIVRKIRDINKQLAADVFKDRFWVRIAQKQRNEYGSEYFMFEMKDRLEPERDSVINEPWIRGDSPFLISKVYENVNQFIIESDFWYNYWGARGKETQLPHDSYKENWRYKL